MVPQKLLTKPFSRYTVHETFLYKLKRRRSDVFYFPKYSAEAHIVFTNLHCGVRKMWSVINYLSFLSV